jgi:type II secretory pathway component HofQ
MVLSAIDTLYRACARVADKPDAQVSVVACDSGGDKSFVFVGDPDVIGRTKDVLLSFWDRVVFYREDRTGERVRVIAESLPILDDIKAIKDAAAADGARKQVIESVMQFAEAGASIPEIQDVAAYDPRELMKPNPDMLVGASSAPTPAASAPAAPAPAPVAPAAPAAVAAPATPEAAVVKEPEPEPAPLNGDELRRIVAAKVDKVLHGAETKTDGSESKDAPTKPAE